MVTNLLISFKSVHVLLHWQFVLLGDVPPYPWQPGWGWRVWRCRRQRGHSCIGTDTGDTQEQNIIFWYHFFLYYIKYKQWEIVIIDYLEAVIFIYLRTLYDYHYMFITKILRNFCKCPSRFFFFYFDNSRALFFYYKGNLTASNIKWW